MKFLRILPALLCLSLLATPSAGQTISPDRVLERYQQSIWRELDGLPSNGIFQMARTPDGYLWLATAEGVVRFDGVRFTTFDTINTPAIRSNNVQALLVDRAGTLWIGTHDGGVSRYAEGRFTQPSEQDGLPDGHVRCLYEDARGGVWVGTDAGVAVFHDGQVTVYSTAAGLPANRVLAITGDPMGGIWVGTLGGLAALRDGRWTTYTTRDGLAGDQISALAWDRAGALWVGTDQGVSRYQDGHFTAYPPASGVTPVRILALTRDRNGVVWAGTAGDGLYRFEDGHLTAARARDGLADDVINAVHEDPEGNIWLGAADGLMQLKVGRFTTYTTADGLPADLVRPIHEDASGTIWAGTDLGLARFADGSFVPYTAPDGRPYRNVTGITEDRTGNLWIHTYLPSPAGSLVARGTPVPADVIEAGWSTRTFSATLEDRSGSRWFGTGTEGLFRIQDGRTWTYGPEEGLADLHVTRLFEDRNGAIWIATAGGLSRFEDERITTFGADDGYEGGHTLSFYEDRDGQLWIGTYGRGLYRYRDGEFAVIRTTDGLYDNLAYQILEDDLGSLWMCANKGVYRASLQELNDFADGRILSVSSFGYGTADGMLSRECNGANPAGVKARDGRLWFPTMRGVVVVDPRQLDQQAPSVVIEGLSVDGQAQPFDESVRIGPGSTNVEIEYTAISWSRAPQVRFRYQLEGLDRDWIDVGTRRTAYFSHLPAGAYTFRLIASNGEGVWSTDGQSIAFVVLPPFYRTWWFTTLGALALLGLGYTAVRVRIGRVEQERNAQRVFSRTLLESQESERRRIAAELHDSLGQSLLVIKNRTALAEASIADADIVREQLGELSASASHAINECREIAYNLRPFHLSRFGLAATLRAIFMRIGEVTNIVVSTDVEAIVDTLPEEAQTHVYRIVQEAANNIIRHSQATEASLEARRRGAELTLVIQDDGVGVSGPERSPANAGATAPEMSGAGLMGMAERVRMLGGRFDLDSRGGTSIRIVLPATTTEAS